MMNKRIEELAEQSEGTKKHVPAVWQFYDHELEKFAELIIQECIDAVMSSDRHRRDYFAEKIKIRFGMSKYED